MAELTYNVVAHGLKGKVGDLLIFRQVKGRTIVGKIPAKVTTRTPAQQAVTGKFVLAHRYAKSAMFRPDIKARYQAKATTFQSAFNRAIADYFTTPEVTYIDHSNYRGQIDDLIRVQVKELGALDYVKVSITKADGTAVEEGLAQRGVDSEEWIYMATKNNAALSGSIILITVANLAGNSSTQQDVMP